MLKYLFTAISFFMFSLITTAQTNKSVSKSSWKINGFGANFGFAKDFYTTMDLPTMYDLTKNPALLDRDLSGMSVAYKRVSNGTTLGLNITLISEITDLDWQKEFRVGFTYSNREPIVSYRPTKTNVNPISNLYIYCHVVNELNLSADYLFRKTSTTKQWLSYYGGLGLNIGSTVNSNVMIIENPYSAVDKSYMHKESIYEAKETIFSRIYIPLGLQVQFLKHFNIGFETNLGIGMQNVIGGNTYFMPLTTNLKGLVSYTF